MAVRAVTYFLLGFIGLSWLEKCSVIESYFQVAPAVNCLLTGKQKCLLIYLEL